MSMRCIECGVNCNVCRGTIKRNMPSVGEVSIPNATWYECPKCGAEYMSVETTDRLSEAYNKRFEELMLSFPLGDFLSVTETYEFLGISRQAFGKNWDIQKKGYIHRIQRFGKWLYLRQSVEAFKKKGDGRISLVDALEKRKSGSGSGGKKKGARQDPKKQVPPRRPRRRGKKK